MRDPSGSPQAATLPDLYQSWIATLLGGVIPAEREATCDACAMLASVSEPAAAGVFFDPRVKCCTYVPALPNFLVGRILLDRTPESAAGRASVVARIAAGVGVMPTGLEQPPVHAVLYRNAQDAFGRSVSMRCPHYQADAGTCGIWRHRQSVCSTWFCKHVRGAVGLRFWTALRRLLEAVERSLVAHCVVSLNPGVGALEQSVASVQGQGPAPLSAAEVDSVPDRRRHRDTWGAYAGREQEFYEASARIVEGLSWDDVVQVSGAQVQLASELVWQAYRALQSRSLPARLSVAPAEIVPLGAAQVRLTAYSSFDPLVVPSALGEVLHYFDGRSTRAALAAISAEGLEVDRRAVRRLVDFGLLIPATSDAAE